MDDITMHNVTDVDNAIKTCFEAWVSAVATGNPDKVLALYADKAILLPTLLGKVCDNPNAIRDYFVHFLAKSPQCVCDESHIRCYANTAINSGHYSFSFGDGSHAKARYTFVYRKKDNQWQIVEHHSSKMPS